MANCRVITDFNEHTVDELIAIHIGLELEYIINDGKIVGVANGKIIRNKEY